MKIKIKHLASQTSWLKKRVITLDKNTLCKEECLRRLEPKLKVKIKCC
ncbi:MAG: hypothetical protein QXQ77_00535 [Candidatus Aenigmatarchaeota archaeon]